MNKRKPYNKLTAAELAEATKQFDAETDLSALGSLSKGDERDHRRSQRATRKRLVAKRSNPVVFDVPPALLARAERVASAQGMTRSELLQRGLLSALAVLDRPAKRSA